MDAEELASAVVSEELSVASSFEDYIAACVTSATRFVDDAARNVDHDRLHKSVKLLLDDFSELQTRLAMASVQPNGQQMVQSSASSVNNWIEVSKRTIVPKTMAILVSDHNLQLFTLKTLGGMICSSQCMERLQATLERWRHYWLGWGVTLFVLWCASWPIPNSIHARRIIDVLILLSVLMPTIMMLRLNLVKRMLAQPYFLAMLFYVHLHGALAVAHALKDHEIAFAVEILFIWMLADIVCCCTDAMPSWMRLTLARWLLPLVSVYNIYTVIYRRLTYGSCEDCPQTMQWKITGKHSLTSYDIIAHVQIVTASFWGILAWTAWRFPNQLYVLYNRQSFVEMHSELLLAEVSRITSDVLNTHRAIRRSIFAMEKPCSFLSSEWSWTASDELQPKFDRLFVS